MVVTTIEAKKLNLPFTSPKITSLVYDPISLSLAFFYSDSTFSLYPSFSPFSLSSPVLLPPKTHIPPHSSSACFVPLNPTTNGGPLVFVTAGSHNGGSRVLLRFYLLGQDGSFGLVTQVRCGQTGVSFDVGLGLVVDLSHGMRVLIVGSVNYFALYSGCEGKVWVFGVRLFEGGLRLVKCAVIDCSLPVSSICLSFGCLILGELNGVRVFPLRALVKGGVGSRRRSWVVKGRLQGLNEGNVKMVNGVLGYEVDKSLLNSKFIANAHVCNVVDGNNESVKPRSLKLRQDSGEVGMQFVLFSDSIVEGMESRVRQYKTAKAISIQALSPQKFLVLDSNGDLHVLYVSKSGPAKLRQLTGIIQAQKMAAFPDTSADTQIIWLSDGFNSVHKLVIPGSDETENDMSINEGKKVQIQNAVTQTVFASERIQDMIPLAANTVLLLGQGLETLSGGIE